MWKDPVWSNVIAGVILSILAAIPLFVRSLSQDISFAVVATEKVTLTIPLGMLYGLFLSCIFLIIILRILRMPKEIRIRSDWIEGNCLDCGTVFPYDAFMSLNELIDLITQNYEETRLQKVDFGKDWFLYDPKRKDSITERSYLPLYKVGITAGSVLELHKHSWSNWKQ